MIPKTIHYCWFGKNPLPSLAIKCIESWKQYCPDYQIIEWNESNYDINKNQYMRDAYQCKKWAFVSDYARLDIVYTYGGIYLDTDIEIIKSFDGLLDNQAFIGFENMHHVSSGGGIGAEKGMHIVKEILEQYNNISFIDNVKKGVLIPCPIHETAVLVKKGLIPNGKKQIVSGMTVYPTDFFHPKAFRSEKIKITDNTVSIHHYGMSWLDSDDREAVELTKKISKYLGKRIGKNVSLIVVYSKNHGFTYMLNRGLSKIKMLMNK